MNKSLGLIETSSIPKGMEILDNILKKTKIELIVGRAICPGKYIIIVEGTVQSVNFALDIATEIGEKFILGNYLISKLNDKVFRALKERKKPENIQSLGIIETKDSVTSIVLADILCDSLDIELLKLQLANGIGGKGLLIFTGHISSVKNAIEITKNYNKQHKGILSFALLSHPDSRLIQSI